MSSAAVTVTAAAVAAADMAGAMMITADVGIIAEHTKNQAFNRTVCITAHAAVKSDTGLSKRILCTGTDAAADKGVHPMGCKNLSQCTVAAALAADDFGGNYAVPFHIVELKLFGMAEVLKNTAVLVSYCNFHIHYSFNIIPCLHVCDV